MRICSVFSLVTLVAVGVLPLVLVGSCASGPPPGASETTPSPSATALSSAQAAPQSGPTIGPAWACLQFLSKTSDATALMDGGVVTSNASPVDASGSSDRLRPMLDVLLSKREAFRCCYDEWAKDHPKQDAKVLLMLELDPKGKLVSAKNKPEEGALVDSGIEACMGELAKHIEFPASPSGKVTTFTYPFNFRHR